MELVREVFAHVCGSSNVWSVGGEMLPFCQRCTGLYVGCFAAVSAYLAFRPKPTSGLLWLHGALLVGMIPFGYHWVSQNDLVRTVTGFLFACGIVFYLLLMPLARWCAPARERHELTLGFLVLSLVSLLAAVSYGGTWAAAIISFLGFVGLMCFVALLGVSAWCLVRT